MSTANICFNSMKLVGIVISFTASAEHSCGVYVALPVDNLVESVDKYTQKSYFWRYGNRIPQLFPD